VQGVSTCSVDDLVQAMGMSGISKSQVGRLCPSEPQVDTAAGAAHRIIIYNSRESGWGATSSAGNDGAMDDKRASSATIVAFRLSRLAACRLAKIG
jgi:hypothetical protein